MHWLQWRKVGAARETGREGGGRGGGGVVYECTRVSIQRHFHPIKTDTSSALANLFRYKV